MNYLLSNYKLSTKEIIQSAFISEYGLRHLELAKEGSKWGHRIIAMIELCPILGIVASIIERLVAQCFYAL